VTPPARGTPSVDWRWPRAPLVDFLEALPIGCSRIRAHTLRTLPRVAANESVSLHILVRLPSLPVAPQTPIHTLSLPLKRPG